MDPLASHQDKEGSDQEPPQKPVDRGKHYTLLCNIRGATGEQEMINWCLNCSVKYSCYHKKFCCFNLRI